MKPEPIKAFLDKKRNFIDTVNSCKTKTEIQTVTDSVTVTETVPSDIPDRKEFERVDDALKKFTYQPKAIAQRLSEDLKDQESFDYYLLLAKNNSQDKLLEALSYTNDASNRGKIKTKKAVYFISIIRNWGLKTRFKY